MPAGENDQPLIERSAALLGLPATCRGETLALAEVRFEDPVWHFVLSGAGRPVEVRVEPAASGDAAYRRTPFLALSYSGHDAPPAILAFLDTLAVRLARITPQGLREAIGVPSLPPRPQPVPGPATGPAGAAFRDEASWEGFHRAWDDPTAWMHFFADREASQDATTAIDPDPAAVLIQHGPHDCLFLCPREFVRRPWRLGHVERSPRRSLATSVDEHDVICGGEGLLGATVRAAAALDPSVLVVHAGCVPQLAGDDAAAVVEEALGPAACPVVCSGSKAEMDPTRFWLKLLGVPPASAGKQGRRPRTYNLLGFRRGRDREELVATLARHGLTLNEAMLPAVPLGARARLPLAAATVVLPCRTWDAAYRELLSDDPTGVVVEAPAPFGRSATAAFLAAVAKGTGAAAAALLEECAAAAPGWDRGVREAREMAIGFAAPPGCIHRLRDGGWTHGVPVVAAVEEMGFRTFVAVLGGEPRAEDVPWLEARSRWTIVGSLADLVAWWRRNGVGAAYSEYGFDSRLTDSGIVPFDTGVFEMGLLGAERTLHRLLTRCRLPLYRQHLGRIGPDIERGGKGPGWEGR